MATQWVLTFVVFKVKQITKLKNLLKCFLVDTDKMIPKIYMEK